MKLADQPMRAELFEDEKGQAIRLPDGIRFEGESVTVRRNGKTVVIEAVSPKRVPPTREEIREMFRRMDALPGRPLRIEDRNQPPPPEPEELFPA